MKRFFILVLLCNFAAEYSPAQSKVFKQVSNEISSEMEPIVQDGNLVGYLMFTQLEKASEDSFNYKISIMDENLNDIGVVNFRNTRMDLQAVSFEKDVLCLAYLKSNIVGREFSNGREYKKALANASTAVVTQFLNLDGKILKENILEAVIDKKPEKYYTSSGKFTSTAKLKHKLQLMNIPQKGFACLYGDEDKTNLLAYDATGKELWSKKIDEASFYVPLTTSDNIFLLSKKEEKMQEGGYAVTVYGADDSKSYMSYKLEDKNGNSLKVLGFGNDPVTGKPFISGNIIDHRRGNKFNTGKQLAKGPYSGVFTIDFNGNTKKDIKENFTYWSDGSQAPAISKSGKFSANNAYTQFATSIRDFDGNTYFIGSSMIKKTKWGTIASSVICLPLIVVSPMILAVGGTQKCKIIDAMILKQNPKGVLFFENSIDCNSSRFNQARVAVNAYDAKRFYQVSNSNTKSDYIIVDDTKDIVIYNINQKKIARTVPHKDGNIRTNIYPAKEGYVMVSEYNKKEKYTRLSIEAL